MARRRNIANSNGEKSLFQKKLDIFRKDLFKTINTELLRIGEDKSKEYADKFVELAKANLDRATPSPESQPLVDEIKNNMRVVKDKRKIDGGERATVGHNVLIPMDPQGLTLFLEYGTGLIGKHNKHPQTDILKMYSGGLFMDWKYAINDNTKKVIKRRGLFAKQKEMTIDWYVEMFGGRGFVFRKNKNSYVDADDKEFHNKTSNRIRWIKEYKRKDGTVVKAHKRYNVKQKNFESKGTYVFSEGIKPVRFIYDAKLAIINEIKSKLK
jgi:hypothetical protein